MALAVPVLAQENGGQLWIQAFEDRNGSGAHDAGEPFLTHGVSVDLLNAEGIVMASATLDGAPYAARGYVGFLYLDPGTYTAVINSPDLTPTTPDRVDVTITADEALVTILYGAERSAADTPDQASGSVSALLASPLARIALSGFGALIVVGVMAFIGLLIYLLVLRRRYNAEVKRIAMTTGSMRAVRVETPDDALDTGELFGGKVRTLETFRVEEEDEEF